MGTVGGYVNPPILSSSLHQAHLFGLREARSRLSTGDTAAHRDVVQTHPLGGPSGRRHDIEYFLESPTDRLLTELRRRLVLGRVPTGIAARIVRRGVVRSLELGEHRANIGDIRSGHTDSVHHRSAGTPEGSRPLWMDPPGVCGRSYVGSRFQLRRWIVVTPWAAMADR